MSQTNTSAVTNKVETQEQEEDYDIPEEVEAVIGELLSLPTLKKIVILVHQCGKSVLHFNLQSIC